MKNRLILVLFIGILMPLYAMEKEVQKPGVLGALFIAQALVTTNSLEEAVKKVREVPNIAELLRESPDLSGSLIDFLVKKFKNELKSKYQEIFAFINNPNDIEEAYKFLAVDSVGLSGLIQWLKNYAASKQIERVGMLVAAGALGELYKKGYTLKEHNAKLFWTMANAIPLCLDSNRLYFKGKGGRCDEADTPLLMAVKSSAGENIREQLAKAFLKFQANPNEMSESGELPLNYVVYTYRPDTLALVKLFLAAGADPSKKNREGKTALDIVNKGMEVPYTSFNDYVNDLEEVQKAYEANQARSPASISALSSPGSGSSA